MPKYAREAASAGFLVTIHRILILSGNLVKYLVNFKKVCLFGLKTV